MTSIVKLKPQDFIAFEDSGVEQMHVTRPYNCTNCCRHNDRDGSTQSLESTVHKRLCGLSSLIIGQQMNGQHFVTNGEWEEKSKRNQKKSRAVHKTGKKDSTFSLGNPHLYAHLSSGNKQRCCIWSGIDIISNSACAVLQDKMYNPTEQQTHASCQSREKHAYIFFPSDKLIKVPYFSKDGCMIWKTEWRKLLVQMEGVQSETRFPAGSTDRFHLLHHTHQPNYPTIPDSMRPHPLNPGHHVVIIIITMIRIQLLRGQSCSSLGPGPARSPCRCVNTRLARACDVSITRTTWRATLACMHPWLSGWCLWGS